MNVSFGGLKGWAVAGLACSMSLTGRALPLEPVTSGSVTSLTHAAEVSTLVTSGKSFLVAGRSTEALALFEKAHALQPSNPEAAFYLSAVYVELKRFDDALPILETLVVRVPDNPMVRNNLAWTLLRAGGGASTNVARAVKLARSALLDAPADPSVWNTLGEAYYAAGDYDKALQAAQSGLRVSVQAGITNSPCRELMVRSRKAAGAASLEEGIPRKP